MIRDYIDTYDTIDAILKNIAPQGYVVAINLKNVTPQVLECTYPSAWWDEYRKRAYTTVDPIIHWGLKNVGQVRWSELEANKLFTINDLVMKRGRTHDLNYGAAFSLRSTTGKKLKSFFGAARADREFTDEEMSIMWTMFTDCVAIVEKHELLTQAEVQALELTAQGYTQKEIAIQIGKSPDLVKLRLRGAKKKLRGVTTAHAVAIAQQRGLISLPGGLDW